MRRPFASRSSRAAIASSALRLDRHVAVRAVLHAELDVEQAQEVMDLGQRADRALAAAAAGALLDRDRRRDAEDRIDVGPRRGLHELPRVRVQRLEVATLAFGEQDVEGERRLAGAGDTGDHREALARNLDVDVLQVVLARVVHDDRIARGVGDTGRCRRDRVTVQRRGGCLRRHDATSAGPDLAALPLVVRERAPGVRTRARDDLIRRAASRALRRPRRRLRARGR